ncbi:hypothetical protein EVAR_52360_1 [Eumeta japonica]|uniref:Uncharacterized protein n=1 Tax=Eumeta variegata TaxID=151549 RepID=A0A4C1YPW7_EUMVA|nr:hypothetical protein EVAR_52360_1 [Eumeta japonica]
MCVSRSLRRFVARADSNKELLQITVYCTSHDSSIAYSLSSMRSPSRRNDNTHHSVRCRRVRHFGDVLSQRSRSAPERVVTWPCALIKNTGVEVQCPSKSPGYIAMQRTRMAPPVTLFILVEFLGILFHFDLVSF